MIPKGWRIITLEEISEKKISYGIVQAGPHVPDGVPYLKSSDVGGRIDPESLQRTDPAIHQKYHRSSVYPGDIVFSLRGNIAATSIVPESLPLANLTQGTARISVSNKYYGPFVRYSLASEVMVNRINSLSKGSTFKEISLAELRKLEILVPSMVEQRRIAEILSTWDRAIEATEKLIANSEAQKKALMQQLLTGKKRLPGFKGEWRKIKFGDVALVGKGRALSSKNLRPGDYPVIAGGKTSPYTHSEYTHDHAITVSASGAYAGYVSYHPYKFWASDCSVVQGSSEIDTLFSYYVLEFNQDVLYGLQSGGAQHHVYPKDIEGLSTDLPCLEEQKAICEILVISSEQLAELQNDLGRLKREKSALMQQLLTGKRRVKLEANQEVAA